MFLFVYRFVHFVCTILTTVAIFCLIISAPMDREKYKPIDGKKKKESMFFVKAQNHFTLFILFQQHGQVSAKMHMELLREMHLSMGLVISKYYIIEFISL